MSAHSDRLLREGSALLQLLNSCGRSSVNCPSTAGAVYDFLNTGRERGAVCAGPGQAFEVSGDYQRGTIYQIQSALADDGAHAVVEATRPASDSRGTMHSFNMVNIRGRFYVADAQTSELRPDIEDYVSYQAFLPNFEYVIDGYRARLVNP